MKKILICCSICLSMTFSYAQRIPPSRLGKLQKMPRSSGRCYPLFYDRKIGISYAMGHKLVGLKFHNSQGWKFGLPLHLVSDFEYRPRYHGNGYFNVDLMRMETMSLGKYSLAVNIGYKRTLAQYRNLNRQLYIGSGFFEKNYGITVAYAGQHKRLSETFTRYDHGILLQYYREFFEQLDIRVSGIYWFDEFQYSIRLNENPFYSRFSVGLGYEKIGHWDEFDISLAYNY